MFLSLFCLGLVSLIFFFSLFSFPCGRLDKTGQGLPLLERSLVLRVPGRNQSVVHRKGSLVQAIEIFSLV